MKFYNKIKETKLCNRVLNKINQLIKNDGKEDKTIIENDYISLAPIDNVENAEVYFQALIWAIEQKKVNNIAITGPYGSGKSSIIETFLKKEKGKAKKEIKSINISLANFSRKKEKLTMDKRKVDTAQGKVDTAEGTMDSVQEIISSAQEEKIEEEILKQLFYKVKYKKLPQSRYKRLHKISGVWLFTKIFIVIAVIGLLIYQLFKDSLQEFNKKRALFVFEKSGIISTICTIVLIVALLIIITYWLWLVLSKVKIKGLNIADKASIELDNTKSSSAFNKNMDEIVYFFEANKFNVVFFEDLDRFGDNSIFIKLRELNTILNNNDMIKRKISFVYVIRDDVFLGKERTKFFDFILPIVPFINSTNSVEVMRKWLGERKYNISDEFVKRVSVYIDDMRILNNVFNELNIYKKLLTEGQKLNLEDEHMAALIIFKNLYPKDFSDLQAEQGIVKEAFENKVSFVKNKIESMKGEYTDYRSILNSIDEEVLDTITELKKIFIFDFVLYRRDYINLSIENKSYSFDEFISDEFDFELLSMSNIVIKYRDMGGNLKTQTIQNVNEYTAKDNGKGIIDKYNYLKYNTNKRKKGLQQQISELQEKERTIRSLKLKELIKQYDIKDILSENVRENKLLVFLLRNGYIDESYSNYMNIFHEHSITADDMNFILSIRNYEAKEFDYKLAKCEQIIDNLSEYEFEQSEIFNYDLLECLLEKMPSSIKCINFIKTLISNLNIGWDFINEFCSYTKHRECFLQLLAKYWNNMWIFISKHPTLDKNRKEGFLLEILRCIDKNTLQFINGVGEDKKKCISEYMRKNHMFMLYMKEHGISVEKTIEILEVINIKFEKKDCFSTHEEVKQYIIENNMYEINPEMIGFVIDYIALNSGYSSGNTYAVDNKNRCNYTAIRKLDNKFINDYIIENFEEYIENVVLAIESNTEEKEEAVLDMLSRLVNNTELCNRIIEKEEVVINNLEDCCGDILDDGDDAIGDNIKTIWNSILLNQRLRLAWTNIMIYYEQFGVSSQLIDFLDENFQVLANEEHSNENVTENFIKDFIKKDIKQELYVSFLRKFGLEDFSIDIESYKEEQIEGMLDALYFTFSVEIFEKIKEIYPKLLSKMLHNYRKEVLGNIGRIHVDSDILESIMVDSNYSVSDKQEIFDNASANDVTINIARYLKQGEINVDKMIVDACWELLPKEERYELLKNNINAYSNNELSVKFGEMGKPYEELEDRKQRHDVWFFKDKYNVELLKLLEKRKYITSTYDKTGHDKQLYIIARVKKCNR